MCVVGCHGKCFEGKVRVEGLVLLVRSRTTAAAELVVDKVAVVVGMFVAGLGQLVWVFAVWLRDCCFWLLCYDAN